MKHFYRFCVWFTEFTLAIAENAPSRNYKYISELRQELSYWRGLLAREEINA